MVILYVTVCHDNSCLDSDQFHLIYQGFPGDLKLDLHINLKQNTRYISQGAQGENGVSW